MAAACVKGIDPPGPILSTSVTRTVTSDRGTTTEKEEENDDDDEEDEEDAEDDDVELIDLRSGTLPIGLYPTRAVLAIFLPDL